MRQLATIRTLNVVKPHPNTDKLELAQVGGWQCVVPKGVHATGDTVVFFEIDSVLPVREPFEFLRKSCYIQRDWVEGFRLRTIRLRGEWSQGLVMPLNVLDQLGVSADCDNLAEAIGVIKWDPPVPACIAGEVVGRFPVEVPKTDQERVQNIDPSKVPGHYEITEKLDGTSMTVIVGPDRDIRVCSRNYELRETESNTLWQVARSSFTGTFDRSLAFQGELIGPGIQGNAYELHRPQYFVFDIYDIDQQRYLNANERALIIEKTGFNHVPVIEHLELSGMSIDEIVAMADGKSVLASNKTREGLVFKSLNRPFSFKAISNKWLLKHG
jgi:RNA ligase (TIGR02306 family)